MVCRNNAGRLVVTLALCVLRNMLAGSQNSVFMCRNGTVLNLHVQVASDEVLVS